MAKKRRFRLKIKPKLRPTNVLSPSPNQMWQATQQLNQEGIPPGIADITEMSGDALGKSEPWSIKKASEKWSIRTAQNTPPSAGPVANPAANPAQIQELKDSVGELKGLVDQWTKGLNEVNSHYRNNIMPNIDRQRYAQALTGLIHINRTIESLKSIAAAIDSNESLKASKTGELQMIMEEALPSSEQGNIFQELADPRNNIINMIQTFESTFLSGGYATDPGGSHNADLMRKLNTVHQGASLSYLKAEEGLIKTLRQMADINGPALLSPACDMARVSLKQMSINLNALANLGGQMKGPTAPKVAPTKPPIMRRR